MHCHIGHKVILEFLPESLSNSHIASVYGKFFAVNIFRRGIEGGRNYNSFSRFAFLHQMVKNILSTEPAWIGIASWIELCARVAFLFLSEPIIFIESVAVKKVKHIVLCFLVVSVVTVRKIYVSLFGYP